jgi:hypothetical protein
MKTLIASKTEEIFHYLGHPLFITLLSAVVAIWITPGIVGRSTARAQRNKARQDQALEMITASNLVDTTLNKIKTEFEAFEKGSVGATADDYRPRRDDLGRQIRSLQSDLDSNAWSWTWSISYRAHFLKLISPQDFEGLKTQATKYVENLVTTCHEFDKPGVAYLRADALPPKPNAAPIMPGLDKRLHDLQSERDELVRKMAEVFQ